MFTCSVCAVEHRREHTLILLEDVTPELLPTACTDHVIIAGAHATLTAELDSPLETIVTTALHECESQLATDALRVYRRNVHWRVRVTEQAREYAGALLRIATIQELSSVAFFVLRRLRLLRRWLQKPMMNLEDSMGWKPPDEEYIYVCGGFDGCCSVSTVDRYDVVMETWKVMPPMNAPRASVGCAVLGSRLYAIGGDVGFTKLNINEGFDLVQQHWISSYASMPTARSGYQCVTLDDRIYVIGGDNRGRLGVVERYDPVTDQWALLASMITPRAHFGCARLGNHIYVTGSYYCKTSMERYDPDLDCWEQMQDMPIGRYMHAAVGLYGSLYVIGGDDALGTSVDRFDPKVSRWTPVASLNMGRVILAAVATIDRIYAIGGVGPSRYGKQMPLEVYDPTTNIWTVGPAMPTTRTWFSAAYSS